MNILMIWTSTNPNEFQVVLVFPFRWTVIETAGGELVLGVIDDMGCIEVRQHGAQTASIPVVSHTTAVVTLARHVDNGIKWDFLIFIDKHLQEKHY